MKKYLLLLFLGYLFANQAYAQSAIKGKVIDNVNREAIPNALIRLKDSKQSTLSNAKGEFELIDNNTLTTRPQLIISHLGYDTQELILSSNINFYIIDLQANTTQLGEVIVAAYQNTQKFLDIAGAVSLITAKELHRDNDAIIAPALNRIAGVYMHNGTLTTNRITILYICKKIKIAQNSIKEELE